MQGDVRGTEIFFGWFQTVLIFIFNDLFQLYHSVVDEELIQDPPFELVGVVCYYGKHYSTFFLHSKMKKWVYFDDATVKEVRIR